MRLFIFSIVLFLICSPAFSVTTAKHDTINDFVHIEKTIWLGKSERANRIQIDLNQLEIKELASRVRTKLLAMQTAAKTIYFREIPPKTDFKTVTKIHRKAEAKSNLGKTLFFEMTASPKVTIQFQTLPEWSTLKAIRVEIENQISKDALKSLAAMGRLRLAALYDLEKRNTTPRYYDYITGQVKEASIITLKELLKSETTFDRLLSAFSLAYLGDDSGKSELLDFANSEAANSSLTPTSMEVFYTKAGLILLGLPIPDGFKKRHSSIKELENAIEDAGR